MKAWVGNYLAVLPLVFAFATTAVAGSGLESQLKTYNTPNAKIRAGFVPVKEQVVLGEPLQVAFWVENLGPTNVEFRFGGDYRGTGRHERFKIAATNDARKVLPDPIAQPMDMGGLIQRIDLKPGEVFTNVINLGDYRVADKPGTCHVSCTFAFDDLWDKKKRTNVVINSTFKLVILERTPKRVAKVLDEMVEKARTNRGQDLQETLASIARFGEEDAIPRLVELAEKGPVEMRAAALRALPLLPTDASLDAVLLCSRDSNPDIRAAAAHALGEMKEPRALDALLAAFPGEKSPVAEAILLALGTTKSERAFPAITNALDVGDPGLQRAAINALVNFGGSNAVAVLRQHLNPGFLSLRYEIVLALAEKMGQPMEADWLSPVLIGREQNHEWLDSLRLLRMYAGNQAVSSLLSYLDFDAAWSGRNWWILNEVRACENAPRCEYDHDYNSEGTPEQWTNNLRTLQQLKALAGAAPNLPIRPIMGPVPRLKTDPPIDFFPEFSETDAGHVQIKSGFLTVILDRRGENDSYIVPEAYRTVYQAGSRFRSLANDGARRADLSITSAQWERLDDLLRQFALKLCHGRVIDNKAGNFYQELVLQPDATPHNDDWTMLKYNYLEAPAGPIHELAKVDLVNSVRAFSQNYHAGTVEFVEAAKNIFTPPQLEQILK